MTNENQNENQNDLSRFATKGEQTRARSIIHRALVAGYSVSVCDGEEWTVKRSRNRTEILDALASTGSDTLRFRNAAGETLGSIVLIYGNAPDGSELAADWSDNEAIAALTASKD